MYTAHSTANASCAAQLFSPNGMEGPQQTNPQFSPDHTDCPDLSLNRRPRTRSRELAETAASSATVSTVSMATVQSLSSSSSSFLGLLWTEEIQLRRALLRSMRESVSPSASSSSLLDSACSSSGQRKRTVSETSVSVSGGSNSATVPVASSKPDNKKSRISYPAMKSSNIASARIELVYQPELRLDPGTGLPVRTGDFLDFLCFHGANPPVPVPPRLRFLALPPSRRVSLLSPPPPPLPPSPRSRRLEANSHANNNRENCHELVTMQLKTCEQQHSEAKKPRKSNDKTVAPIGVASSSASGHRLLQMRNQVDDS